MIWYRVRDFEAGRVFFTETLGFEVRNDSVLDGFRWLTVGPKGQPDLAFLLAYPAPPMFSAEDAETVRGLVAKGSLGGGVFATDDCRKTFEELSAKGVTFLQEAYPLGDTRAVMIEGPSREAIELVEAG